MRAVADASPLIFLARLGLLELLADLYDEVFVPRAVLRETTRPHHPGAQTIVDCSWLLEVEDPRQLEGEMLSRHLGPGETAALLVARAISADEVLIDEQRARSEAKTLGLRVRGTIGILASAKNRRLLSDVRPHLDRLAQIGARIHPSLRREILKSLNEE